MTPPSAPSRRISRDELRKNHVVDLVDGRFSKRRTRPEDLAAIFRNIGQDPDGKHLVVHFHGGLVSRRSALDAAETLYPVYRGSGAYPLFFVWNSDPVNALLHNLDEIAEEKAFWRIVQRISQLLIGKLAEGVGPARGGRVVMASPKDVPDEAKDLKKYLDAQETGRRMPDPVLRKLQQQQLERALRRDRELREVSRAIAQGMRDPDEIAADAREHRASRGRKPLRASQATLMSRKVIREIQREAPRRGARSAATFVALVRYGVRIARAVLKRYREGRDHGLYTTTVEETLRALYIDNVGQLGWELIKGDTLDAFAGDPAVHGGTAFLEGLRAAGKSIERVTLLGHSTGAIYIGHLLEHADRVLPKRWKADVAFFAPACTFDFVDRRLAVFRRRVAHLRNFGLSDPLEHGYWQVPVLYDASLLYLVSGVLEEAGADTPLVGMERYYDRRRYSDRAIRRVADYLGPESFWSVADQGDGRRTAAERHGGFEREDTTKESQRHFLTHGFQP